MRVRIVVMGAAKRVIHAAWFLMFVGNIHGAQEVSPNNGLPDPVLIETMYGVQEVRFENRLGRSLYVAHSAGSAIAGKLTVREQLELTIQFFTNQRNSLAKEMAVFEKAQKGFQDQGCVCNLKIKDPRVAHEWQNIVDARNRVVNDTVQSVTAVRQELDSLNEQVASCPDEESDMDAVIVLLRTSVEKTNQLVGDRKERQSRMQEIQKQSERLMQQILESVSLQ